MNEPVSIGVAGVADVARLAEEIYGLCAVEPAEWMTAECTRYSRIVLYADAYGGDSYVVVLADVLGTWSVSGVRLYMSIFLVCWEPDQFSEL